MRTLDPRMHSALEHVRMSDVINRVRLESFYKAQARLVEFIR